MDKEAFFSATERATSMHEVEGFGTVALQALTLSQRQELPGRFEKNAPETTAWLVCMGMRDLDESDMDNVSEMDTGIIQELADGILRLSGLSDESVDEAKND